MMGVFWGLAEGLAWRGGPGWEGTFSSPPLRSSFFPGCRRRSFVPLTLDKHVFTPCYVTSTVREGRAFVRLTGLKNDNQILYHSWQSHMFSLNLHHDPEKHTAFSVHFVRKRTKAQRGQEAFPWSHSYKMRKQESKPRSVTKTYSWGHRPKNNEDRRGIKSSGASTQVRLGVSGHLNFLQWDVLALLSWAGNVTKRGSSSARLKEFWALHTAWLCWWRSHVHHPWAPFASLKLKHAECLGNR